MTRTLPTGEPLLLDRTEIENLRARWPDAPNWPPEVDSAGWHSDEAPRVGAGVLLFYRRPTSADAWVLTWQWALVREVRRWMIVVELPDALPGTGLAAGDRIELDAEDYVHAIRGAAQAETPAGKTPRWSAPRSPFARRLQ